MPKIYENFVDLFLNWAYSIVIMTTIFPFFKSNYSIGRSILTLENPDKTVPGGPDSIFSLCKGSQDRFFLADDSISGVMEALTNANKNKINLTYGLRLTHVRDAQEKTEDSLRHQSKVILLMNGTDAYKDLLKISTLSSTEGFYYEPRVDDNILKKVGTSNLTLVVPFYDSFIYSNNLENGASEPSFLKLFKNVFFAKEDNDLPFDSILSKLVDKSAKEHSSDIVNIKSIYYAQRADFLSYLSFRCIHNRSSLQKPNFDHLSSQEFCFQSYAESRQ